MRAAGSCVKSMICRWGGGKGAWPRARRAVAEAAAAAAAGAPLHQQTSRQHTSHTHKASRAEPYCALLCTHQRCGVRRLGCQHNGGEDGEEGGGRHAQAEQRLKNAACEERGRGAGMRQLRSRRAFPHRLHPASSACSSLGPGPPHPHPLPTSCLVAAVVDIQGCRRRGGEEEQVKPQAHACVAVAALQRALSGCSSLPLRLGAHRGTATRSMLRRRSRRLSAAPGAPPPHKKGP